MRCDYQNMCTKHTQLKSSDCNFCYLKVCLTNINMLRVKTCLFQQKKIVRRHQIYSSKISLYFCALKRRGFFIANGQKEYKKSPLLPSIIQYTHNRCHHSWWSWKKTTTTNAINFFHSHSILHIPSELQKNTIEMCISYGGISCIMCSIVSFA